MGTPNPSDSVIEHPVIGTFPESWSTSRFGREFEPSNERNGTQPIGPMLSVSEYRGIEVRTNFRDGQLPSEDVSHYRVVRPGQLVANMMWLDHGGLGVSSQAGYVSPAYMAFNISDRVEPTFAHYILRSSIYVEAYKRLGRGVRPNSQMVDSVDLRLLPFPLPPIGTQRRIADYLDRETAEIDAAVADLDKYVELLEKRRTTRLVEETRIRTTTRMTKIGRHAQVILGKTLQTEQKNANEELVNYVRAGSIQPNGVFDWEEKQMWMTPGEQSTYSIIEGDVLVVEGGAGYGRSVTLDHDLQGWGFQNHVIRIRPQSGWIGQFIDYSIRAQKAEGLIDLLAVGATIPGFSSERARNLPIAFLSEEEQRQIVHSLDEEMGEIDSLIAESTKLRDLLLKRRSVLITEVVTGRKQV